MQKVTRFEDLICWQKSRALVKEVYLLSDRGKFARDFDLKSQIRRAAISTMNNIAEGFGRYSGKEFARYLEISSASAQEVKSRLYVVLDLEYAEPSVIGEVQCKTEEAKALKLGLIRYINGRRDKNSR